MWLEINLRAPKQKANKEEEGSNIQPVKSIISLIHQNVTFPSRTQSQYLKYFILFYFANSKINRLPVVRGSL